MGNKNDMEDQNVQDTDSSKKPTDETSEADAVSDATDLAEDEPVDEEHETSETSEASVEDESDDEESDPSTSSAADDEDQEAADEAEDGDASAPIEVDDEDEEAADEAEDGDASAPTEDDDEDDLAEDGGSEDADKADTEDVEDSDADVDVDDTEDAGDDVDGHDADDDEDAEDAGDTDQTSDAGGSGDTSGDDGDGDDGKDIEPMPTADRPGELEGVAAFFEHPKHLLAAASHARDSDYEEFDAFSPFPIHGMDEAMGLGRSWIPWVTFGAGATGFILANLLQFGTMTFDWPMIIGGKPYAPWPSFVPVMFELTVLLAGVTTAVVMLKAAGCFQKPTIIDPRITDDRFVLWISAGDDAFEENRVVEFLEALNPLEVRKIVKDA